MFATIVQKRLRVSRSEGPLGESMAVARQMDAVLLTVGFSASRELLEHVSELSTGSAMDLAVSTIGAVQKLVGDHVNHNSYFKNFPAGVPDTVEFWVECLRGALVPASVPDARLREFATSGALNLLSLPTYGSYQHSYAELVEAHNNLVESSGGRITVLALGDTLEEECQALYLSLASSTTPLNETDLVILELLSGEFARKLIPAFDIPVRENKAVINAARLAVETSLLQIDTVTDVLRVASLASCGDVTLATPTKFRNFSRRERRILLNALHQLGVSNRAKLADAGKYAERWKKLAKALHPDDYPEYIHAGEVFRVARGESKLRSVPSAAETAFRAGSPGAAARVLSIAPGLLLRSLDRLLRESSARERDDIVEIARKAMEASSGRVLLSLAEHLYNRRTPDAARVFAGKSRRVWVQPDDRKPIPAGLISYVGEAIEAELSARVPEVRNLVVDPSIFGIALPLSGKASESGFSVMPRGSRSDIYESNGNILRFFIYWKEKSRRTDFDLSVQLLDANFGYVGQVSYTNYRLNGIRHSGDLTESSEGATEFIDIDLSKLDKNVSYILPQVNVYSGEDFNEVEESIFGWMQRSPAQQGMPFEARTVRARSDMRGEGRIALPMAFARVGGNWSALWMHMYLKGMPNFNRIESNRLSSGLLFRGTVQRHYLTLQYLIDLWAEKAGSFALLASGESLAGVGIDESSGPVTYIGLEAPEGLPEGSDVFGPDRFSELIPG